MPSSITTPPPRKSCSRLQVFASLAAVITWPVVLNDRLNHESVAWDTSNQRWLVQTFTVWTAPTPTGPWQTYALTNRPPVRMDTTNPAAFFRLTDVWQPR